MSSMTKILAALSVVLVVLFVGCEPMTAEQRSTEKLLKIREEARAEQTATAVANTPKVTLTAQAEDDMATATALANAPKVTLTARDAIIATMGYSEGEQRHSRAEHSHFLVLPDYTYRANSYRAYPPFGGDLWTDEASTPFCRSFVFGNWSAYSYLEQNRQWWRVSANVNLDKMGSFFLGRLSATWRVDDRTITVFPATFTYTTSEGQKREWFAPCI
jgi:hypothetical protein